MCPRISVPISSSSSSSSFSSSFSSSSSYPPSLHVHVRACRVCICIYICVYICIKNPTSAVHARGGGLPSCTDTLLLTLLLLLTPLLRFARTVISYLYLSPPTTYTPPSSRRTTGIISVFPQTRLTRNVVQQALRALSTGRDILLLPAALSRSLLLWLSTRLDSTD